MKSLLKMTYLASPELEQAVSNQPSVAPLIV